MSVAIKSREIPGTKMFVVEAPAKFAIGEAVNAFREKCNGLIQPGVYLAIDVSLVTFNDSVAIGALVSLYNRLTTRFLLVNPAKRLRDELAITKLDQVLPRIEGGNDEQIVEAFIANTAPTAV